MIGLPCEPRLLLLQTLHSRAELGQCGVDISPQYS